MNEPSAVYENLPIFLTKETHWVLFTIFGGDDDLYGKSTTL